MPLTKTQEVDTEEPIQTHPCLYTELKSSLGYLRQNTSQPGVVMLGCNPSIQKAETKGL